ncbi:MULTISPECIES: LysR family transcriptional regulator [Roseovarius]|jgi:DNA-binding transcriptional LysR family regulator|uniref:Transcriptional regulator, LysR family protein n=2 Tax=Roseovarius nubinhibens TaxID=314263 RepID=A3SM19_ROSNI|nr:LysR family transcriptional regulator [Roseovarius nubinhibens]EAP78400.1 transcriptional regulator, LysR family protein [Roseovarius nubinhibens ISM]MBU3000231.1 LysR family transcriptional regulator [Roseovarius nubinhibens]HAR52921.1 LysR family transcriptional regulator [Roseovarius nubinhibens]|tara:strand:- start:8173 stop:9054 length:882 start_codon:yes stop_codon:yes gene_type:complete
MDNWDEIRTAYHVARVGTVSGAAERLGVHHATVIRHIDALEERLGVKLFQRHARGYTATEAGDDLLRVAQATDDQFSQLVGRIRGRGDGVSGDLVVTSLGGLSHLLVPVLTRFREDYPEVVVRFLTGDRLFRLEYGEAHVAIRAGSVPDQPDNVVQPFVKQRVALYASRSYVERHGAPKDLADMANHFFVGADDPNSRAPFMRWMREHIPAENIVFRSGDFHALRRAIIEGAGIGFMFQLQARELDDMVEILPPQDDWTSPLWLVTHMDLHRTTKVQAFLTVLKEAAKEWENI